MTLAAATRLGPYEIIAPLGAGGMGEVYQARDPRLGRDVAIKVLPEDLADEPDRLRRFENEAKAAGALNHPNVLAIHDIGNHEGRPYVVYELLEGETLGERLRSRRLSRAEAVDCGVQAARGLAAAHAKGIVHRDLKPENLFLTKDGPLKILDFGLAKLVRPEGDDGEAFDGINESRLPESLTAAGTILGTAGYMSPEQVKGERADHRSDIFSLGVVLHEMLSGQTPFTGETVPEMLTAILKEDPPELSDPDVSPALAEITGRCLAKEPGARFQSAHDLSLALGAVSGVENVVPSVSGLEPAPVAAGGGRALLLVGGGLVLLAGLAAVLWTELAPSGPPRMIGPRQVTTDGVGKWGLATDGKWLYYSTFEGRVFQMSVGGGQASEIDPWPNEKMWTFVRDINPADSTELLVVSRPGPPWTNPFEELPLWVLSLPAANPRRLGEATANSAAWSPSGDEIAYSRGTDIFVVGRDGESPRRVLTAAGAPGVRDWAGGDRILHTVYSVEGRGIEPWAMHPDGTGRRRLLPDWPEPYFWDFHPTPDGRYLLFISGEETGGGFWALQEGAAEPVALGTDPLQCYFFTLDPDGLAAYATCMKRRSELFVYRSEVGEWAPYDFPPESSAWWLVDSSDEEWVAWAKYPEGTLWRSRRDGSQKLQLTEPGNLYATFPSWSPDGEWILFGMGTLQGVVQKTFVVSSDGQGLRQVADDGTRKNRAAWAPDGRVVLSFWDEEDLPLRLVDLETGESEEMPGTSLLYGVTTSPDGRYLAATNRGHQGSEQIHLLDWETGEWRALEGAAGGLPQWSADSRFLYYTPDVGGDLTRWQVHRRRLDDGHTETVAEPTGLRASGHTIWWRVDPEGRIVAQRSLEIWDIYAWDLELPKCFPSC